MIPFFVQIKCQLGKSYDVANALAESEIASEIYSTAGEFDLLVKFYVEEGTDIGELDELVRLGVEAGLVEREARAALVLREGQDGVVAAERHAGTLNITSVPTYIFDGQYTLSGAQEPSNMARILDQVAEFAAAREAAP